MAIGTKTAIVSGALLVSMIALVGARSSDSDFAENLSNQALVTITEADAAPVKARFSSRDGWPTRHTVLSGGEDLDEEARDRVAKAVATIKGVGGVSWADGSMLAQTGMGTTPPILCQDDVAILLGARSIRFEESRSDIASTSAPLLDEVAAALKPCLGSVFSITGHTDASGPEPDNIALSRARAASVVAALRQRGIPTSSLVASGLGSSQPIDGLSAQDPANRRIEFEVVSTSPVKPTPIDIPGPR